MWACLLPACAILPAQTGEADAPARDGQWWGPPRSVETPPVGRPRLIDPHRRPVDKPEPPPDTDLQPVGHQVPRSDEVVPKPKPVEDPPNKPVADVGPSQPANLPEHVLEPKTKPEDSPLVVAVRCIEENRPQEAVELLGAVGPLNQELLLRILPQIVRLSKTPIEKIPPPELTRTVDQLRSTQDMLSPRAELLIENVTFCRQVLHFGCYTRLNAEEGLHPGEYVHLYAEIRNFTSSQQPSHYHINLDSVIEILEFNGTVLHREAMEDRKQPIESQTRLHDYFNLYGFSIPDKLRPGLYMLRLTVTDLPTKRTAQKSINFQVVSSHHR